MGKMRITMKCHTPKCKNWINESMARLMAIYWYYCSDCVDKQKREKLLHKALLS